MTQQVNQQITGQVSSDAAVIYENHFVPALFAGWPKHVLAAAGVKAGDRVLDVACGTGVLAREAMQRVGTKGSVAGVDINDGMLAMARTKSPEIQWHCSPAESLPFADGSFDRVVCQFGLMFFQDPVKAIGEMRRVMRSGGTCAVAVWATLSDVPGYRALTEVLHELFGADIAKGIEVPFSLGNRYLLQDMFKEAGQASIDIETVRGTVRFNSLSDWLYINIKGWTLAEFIDDEGYNELERRAPGALAQFVQPDGTVAFAASAQIVRFS